MVKIVVDSSVLIDFSRTGKGLFLELNDKFKQGEVDILIPTVVIYEFWSGRSMASVIAEKKAKELLSKYNKIVLGEIVAEKAGDLTRKFSMEGMDAIIAATCLEEKAELATLNQKHFAKVPGLKLWRS